MKQNHRYVYFIWLFCIWQSYAAITVKGDSNAPFNQSFPFAIRAHIQNVLASNFYVAADPSVFPGQSGEFAISAVARDQDVFRSFAPKIVNLNGISNSENPLFDKGIAFLGLLQGQLVTSGGFGSRGEHVIAVSADDRKTIYLLLDFLREKMKKESESSSSSSSETSGESDASDATEPQTSELEMALRLHMRSASNNDAYFQNIPDANGQVTSGIVGLLGTQAHVLASVAPNNGAFGDQGSGVAEVVLGSSNQTALFTVVNAGSGNVEPNNKAAALDRSSDFIKIGNDLFSMDDIVDMHWSFELGTAFIALRVTASGGASDGARAIVVAHFDKSDEVPQVQDENKENPSQAQGERDKKNNSEISKTKKEKTQREDDNTVRPEVLRDEGSNESDSSSEEPTPKPQTTRNKLILGAIAPVTAFDTTSNKIVGVIGADEQLSIHKVRTMHSSTDTFYLIVLGGNGAPEDTTRQVFALPIVNGAKDPLLNGTLADKNQIPQDDYGENPENIVFLGDRRRPLPALYPSQLVTSDDVAAQVGGGAVPFGDVTDLFVSRDAVFVTVLNGDGNQQPGIFYSQAILNEFGVVVAWTQWQRVSGRIDQVLGGAVDPTNANIYTMVTVDGQVNTVKRTNWSAGAPDSLAQMVNAFEVALPQACGGVRGLFDMPVNTPGLLDSSLMVGVGRSAIILAQTGMVELGALIPTSDEQFKNVMTFEQGTITTDLPISSNDPSIVTVVGGALSEITPIIAAEIAANNEQGWIVCGGCRGIAILSDDVGNGWDLGAGLGPNFAGLRAGMTFKRIGGYSFVRKLMCDDGFLYVLTDTQLDRIDLSQGNIGLGQFDPVTIAQLDHVPGGTPNGVFLDFIVSGKLAFIATSIGLIRVGDHADIRVAANQHDAHWTLVDVPENGGPIYKLISFPTIGTRAQDLARGNGGDLYALGTNRGKERSQLNRFIVKGLGDNDQIDTSTILPFPDLFIKNTLSYLVNFGDQRTSFATDGSVFFHARSFERGVNARVETLPILQSPPASGYRFQGPRSTPVEIGIPTNSFIGAIVRDSASGSWVISGDYGLRVNE